MISILWDLHQTEGSSLKVCEELKNAEWSIEISYPASLSSDFGHLKDLGNEMLEGT